MNKQAELSFSIDKVKTALQKLIDVNSMLKQGDLQVDENIYSFSYSQFGTSTAKITLQEISENSTALNLELELASTHKVVVTENNINTNFEKYIAELNSACALI